MDVLGDKAPPRNAGRPPRRGLPAVHAGDNPGTTQPLLAQEYGADASEDLWSRSLRALASEKLDEAVELLVQESRRAAASGAFASTAVACRTAALVATSGGEYRKAAVLFAQAARCYGVAARTPAALGEALDAAERCRQAAKLCLLRALDPSANVSRV